MVQQVVQPWVAISLDRRKYAQERQISFKLVVEVKGIEPLAPCMQSRCSPAELHPHETTPNYNSR